MIKKYFLFGLFFGVVSNFWGQITLGDYKEKNWKTYEEDFLKTYQLCQNSRIDSTHRICIAFMKDYGVRNDLRKLNLFCDNFLKLNKNIDNDALERRIKTILLTNTCRLKQFSDGDINQKFKQLFTEFYKNNDYSAALECFYEKAMLLNRKKQYHEVLKILYFCEKFAVKNNLQNDLCYQRILHEIAYKLLNFDQYSLSINYFKKAIATKNCDAMDQLIALNAIGIGYQKLNKLDQSNSYLQQASTLALKEKNQTFNAIINGNIGLNKFNLGRFNEAKKYIDLDKKVSLKYKIYPNAISSMALLAQIDLKENKINEAKILIDSINNIALKIDSTEFKAFKNKHEINYLYFLKLKNYEKSLYHYQKLNDFEKLIQNYSNSDKISLLEVKASSELLELEIKKIEDQKKLKVILTVLFFIVFAISIIIVVYYIVRKLKKMEQSKNEIFALTEEQSKEIERLKFKLYQQLELIKNKNEKYQNTTIEIPDLKDFNLSKKEQWNDFKQLFDITFPDFEIKLFSINNAFSKTEQRLIMLHKLGLSNKEISEALFISIDGVKKANYRLYKKMNLKSSQELNDIFN